MNLYTVCTLTLFFGAFIILRAGYRQKGKYTPTVLGLSSFCWALSYLTRGIEINPKIMEAEPLVVLTLVFWVILYLFHAGMSFASVQEGEDHVDPPVPISTIATWAIIGVYTLIISLWLIVWGQDGITGLMFAVTGIMWLVDSIGSGLLQKRRSS